MDTSHRHESPAMVLRVVHPVAIEGEHLLAHALHRLNRMPAFPITAPGVPVAAEYCASAPERSWDAPYDERPSAAACAAFSMP
jgi:hypothetical protein